MPEITTKETSSSFKCKYVLINCSSWKSWTGRIIIYGYNSKAQTKEKAASSRNYLGITKDKDGAKTIITDRK
jgi:hypothetical protein